MEDRRILVDTSVVIDHFRKKNNQKSLLYELSKDNKLFLSAISKFEFLVGTKPSQISQTEKLIEGFFILSFNSNVAAVASDIAKKLKTKNKIIEFRDMLKNLSSRDVAWVLSQLGITFKRHGKEDVFDGLYWQTYREFLSMAGSFAKTFSRSFLKPAF